MDALFPQAASLIYLNHAAVGPWPQCTHDAITAFSQENLLQGARDYPQWLQIEQQLRQRLKALINAESTDCIALLKNTSEALSVIAYGLDWQAGDNVVLASQEFPSNRIVWESLRDSYGVEARIVTLPDINQGGDPEAALLNACDENTRLITSSSVHYASGLKMDLTRIGQFCQQHNILFCVDAIQSLGAFVFDAQAVHADFVVADGHKWMLGPEGLALFYCREPLLQKLTLKQYGWHMLEHAGDYDRQEWQAAKTAIRFECGSPNMLGIHGLHASLGLLQSTGLDVISSNILTHVAYLLDKLASLPGITINSPQASDRQSGIVNFSFNDIDSAAIQQALMQENVICAYRGGGIRFSPHYYTQTEQLDSALEILSRLLEQ